MNKALVVGINHFLNYPEYILSGCVPDGRQMAEVYSWLGCSVVELYDDQALDYIVLNRIQEIYQEIILASSYYVGLWFSSHGTHYPEPREPDGLGEALVCNNIMEKDGDWVSGFIKDKTFRFLLNRFPPQGIVEIGFDTCYSGGMDRIIKPRVKDRFMHNPGNKESQLRIANTTMNMGLNPNIIMWCASSEAETSSDAYIENSAHGAFTYYWVKALKENPKASRVEILLKTRKYLADNKFKQTPRLKCWNAKAQGMVGV